MTHSKLAKRLCTLKQKGGYRQARTINSAGYTATNNNKQLINFSGNDYLGLAGDPELQSGFFDGANLRTANWMASSSSRSLTGTTASHAVLEENIARSYGKTRALVFNSGYHANSGLLPALTGKGDLILSDELIHASMIDGIRLGKADCLRFKHNDIEHLDSLLTEHRANYQDVWIVTESIFSMDGDRAPLHEIIALKKKYQLNLYLDEAHAVGCAGERGLGFAEALGVIDDIDLLIGTFGKALAGYGGFAVANDVLVDSMINFARSWIFSTALPPITIDWNNYIWLQLPGFDTQRQQLNSLAHVFKQGLGKLNLAYLGDTHITPLMRSGNENAVALARTLEAHGFLALPIRSPTVAKGSERLRFSISADVPENEVTRCLELIEQTLKDTP